jgi:16S rRNA (guanine966-N2)-methyltransferase
MLRICAGRFKGKHLKLPPQSISRPSSNRLRQAIFNVLASTMQFDGLCVLDGFAGSGALGLEALSRGASSVVFCETNLLAQAVLKENILNTTKAVKSKVTIAPDIFYLKTPFQFDVVFLDPPYDKGLEAKALQYLLDKKLISPNGIVIIEQRKGATVVEHLGLQSLRIYGKCQITILQLCG